MTNVELCTQVSKLIDEMEKRGIADSFGVMQAKMILTPAGGTPEREAMLWPEGRE